MIRRLALVAGLVLFARPAVAQTYTFAVNQVTAAAGSTNNRTLEVTLTYTGAGSSPDIGGFQFRLTAAGAAGVSFTDADASTATSGYIYAGAAGLAYNPASAVDFTANDIGARTLQPGDTVGLGRVTFDVSANAGPPVDILFSQAVTDTTLYDSLGMTLPGTYQFGNGSVTPVPEPVLVGALAACGLLVARRGRQQSHHKAVRAAVTSTDSV